MTDIGHEPPLDPPEGGSWPRCPVCGAATDSVFRNGRLEIVGCWECLEIADAFEVCG